MSFRCLHYNETRVVVGFGANPRGFLNIFSGVEAAYGENLRWPPDHPINIKVD